MTESLITFLFEVANFVVFVFLLGWFFVKPVRKFLDEQAARDAEAQRKAEEHLAEAESLRQQLQHERQHFANDMETQRQKVLTEARQEANKLIEEAQQNVQRQHEQLLRDVGQVQQRQKTKLANLVAEATRQAVSNLLQEIDGPDLESALVSSACKHLKETSLDRNQPVLVESAIELNDQARKQIANSLRVEPSNGNVKFQVVGEIIGGVRVRTASGLVDHSIRGLSQFVEQDLQRELNHDD